MIPIPVGRALAGRTSRFAFGSTLRGRDFLPIIIAVAAIAIGSWVYWDARQRGVVDWAPLLGVAVGGLLLAGSLPGLVALAVADDAAVQGFPTAIRVLPGVLALAVYVRFR